VHVEAILRDVDAGEDRRGGRQLHDPSLRMRARTAAAQTTVRVPGWDNGRRPELSRGLEHPRRPPAAVRRQPRRLAAGRQLRDTRCTSSTSAIPLEFTHDCLAIRAGRKLKAADVADVLSDLSILRGVPAHIRSDGGPELWPGRCKAGLRR
jgi:hypothetical protein